MTKEGAAGILLMNKNLFPWVSQTEAEIAATVGVWVYSFKGYDDDTVKRAFMEAAKVCTRPITIADVYKQMSRKIDPASEWEQLKNIMPTVQKYLSWKTYPKIVGVDDNGKAIKSNGTEELKELFDSLSQSLKAYVGGVGGLIELAQTPDLTYRRLEYIKQAKADIETAPKEAAQLRSGDSTALLSASNT